MAFVSELPDLAGTWRIRRRVLPCGARFEGVAVISGPAERLNYSEKGCLHLADSSHEAYRDYIYVPNENLLEILHPEGKSFLKLAFAYGQARDSHHCGDDFYEAVFRFKGPDRLVTAFDIAGPKKRHRIVSVLTRL